MVPQISVVSLARARDSQRKIRCEQVADREGSAVSVGHRPRCFRLSEPHGERGKGGIS